MKSSPKPNPVKRLQTRDTRVSKGEKSAFPQARLVASAESGTHAMGDLLTFDFAGTLRVIRLQMPRRVRALQPGSSREGQSLSTQGVA